MTVKIKGITRRLVTRRIDRATSENFNEYVLNERTQAWLRYDDLWSSNIIDLIRTGEKKWGSPHPLYTGI